MSLINPEQFMPIILEGIRWVKEKTGPSKKDLELQMSDLKQQVSFLMKERGENLAYLDYIICEILKRVQTPGNIVINANTINIYYERPNHAHVASPFFFDKQELSADLFEGEQEDFDYERPEHTCIATPRLLDKRRPWVVPFERRQEESLTSDLSYVKARADVVYRHLEVLLSCSRIAKSDFKTLFEAVERKELYYAGVYLENNDRRIAEVEIAVNWYEHHLAIVNEGAYFYINHPDWQDGASPEIYAITSRLLKTATRMGKPIYAWFSTLKKPARGREKHERTFYYCEKRVPPWATAPLERQYPIDRLQEITITTRVSG